MNLFVYILGNHSWRSEVCDNPDPPAFISGRRALDELKARWERREDKTREVGTEICHSRLMALATQPAPKPLSMLTTQVFEAQLLSIPSKAASPPKLAP